MMERKTNYFKEIHSSMDTFLALLLGFILGLGVFAVDKFDIVSWVIGRFQVTGLYAGLIMAGLMSVIFASVGLLILLMLPKLFSKNVVKTDFVLLTYDAAMLTMLGTTAIGLNGLTGRLILWASFLGVGLILTVIRMICVRSHEGEDRLQMKEYMSVLSKKYNLPLLTVFAIMLGTGLGILLHYVNVDAAVASVFAPWAELTKHQKYGYVGGAVAVLLLGLIITSMAGGKRNKVCFLDALLYLVTGIALMSGVYFAYSYPNYPTFEYLTWISIISALVLTLFVRSLFISADVKMKPRAKGLRAYYGKLAEEKSLALIILISAFIMVGLTVIDLVGLIHCFSTPLHMGVSAALIAVLLLIGLIGFSSLCKGGLVNKKINAIDGVLNVAFVTGTLLIFNLCNLLGLVKTIVWAVVYFIIIIFIIVRSRFIEGEAPKTVETVVEEKAEEPAPVEEPAETPVEETPVAEEAPVAEETPAEEDDGDEESVEGDDYSRLNNIRRLSFAQKLAVASDQTLNYYSEIKNLLLSYGTKSRIAKKNEAYRKSGLIAKISISGKSLRLHLPLDPHSEEFSESKYHQIDLSAKKQYAEVAFTLRIKSDRALKRALELITKVCEDRGLKLRKGYVPVDFASELRNGIEPTVEEEVIELTPEVVTEESTFNGLSIRRLSFNEKLQAASDETLKYYSEIKNALLSYGTKARTAKKNEAYRKSGLVAKVSISGKSLRLHLPLDPNSQEFDRSRYHQIDLSAKKQYAEVAFTLRIKSDRALRRALELIAKVCESRGLKLRKGYVPVDFYSEIRGAVKPAVEEVVELTPEVVTEETTTLSIRRSTYGNKLKFASEQAKEYYSTLKNALLSYGTKSRPSKKNEAFRKSGLVAKLSLSGKSIRLHLPLDPNSEELSESKYHQIDLSAKKQYAEVPFTVKVKSDRGLKRALELITKVCEERGLKLRKNYEEVNFAKELELDGEAIFEKLGCKDAMTSSYNPEYLKAFKENHKEAYEDLLTLLPTVKKDIADDGETHNVYLDTALEKMSEDLVNIETLRKVYEITSSVTHVVIKIHDNLDRKITVYCDEISTDAALAVLALGGKVFLTK